MTTQFTQSPSLNLSDGTTQVTRYFRGTGCFVLVQGDFKTGTVALDISVDEGTTWVPYPSNLLPTGSQLTWTSNGLTKIDAPYCTLRFTITGANAGYNVDIYLW